MKKKPPPLQNIRHKEREKKESSKWVMTDDIMDDIPALRCNRSTRNSRNPPNLSQSMPIRPSRVISHPLAPSIILSLLERWSVDNPAFPVLQSASSSVMYRIRNENSNLSHPRSVFAIEHLRRDFYVAIYPTKDSRSGFSRKGMQRNRCGCGCNRKSLFAHASAHHIHSGVHIYPSTAIIPPVL
jgi:hypothetical protein